MLEGLVVERTRRSRSPRVGRDGEGGKMADEGVAEEEGGSASVWVVEVILELLVVVRGVP